MWKPRWTGCGGVFRIEFGLKTVGEIDHSMATRSKHRHNIPLIVYCSRTDNTRRVAEAMASPLAAELVSIEHLKVHQLRGPFSDRPGIGGLLVAPGAPDRRPGRQDTRWLPGVHLQHQRVAGPGAGHFLPVRTGKKVGAAPHRGDRPLALPPGHDRQPLFKWLQISRGRPNEGRYC